MVLCLKCQYNFLFQSLTALLTVTHTVICKGKAVKLQGVQQETRIALHQNGPEVTDTSLEVTERWYLKKKNAMLKIIPQLRYYCKFSDLFSLYFQIFQKIQAENHRQWRAANQGYQVRP